RRTRTSSSGFFLLLIARMVLAREPPSITWKRLSFLNCGTTRVATRGKASTSPDSSAAAWAAGSEMKRKVTLLILAWPGLRKPAHFVSTADEPLVQLSSLYGPVPTGLVALESALLGSTITAVACPSRNGRSGSISLLSSTTV